MARYATVDEYMASLPEDRRAVMEELRRAVREAVPEATETIAYNMPALRLNGRFLLSYEAYKRHYGLFPWTDRMVAELGDEIRPICPSQSGAPHGHPACGTATLAVRI
jgi:uncharacterized protein YdhG (YjbR/CyaY superfamily)